MQIHSSHLNVISAFYRKASFAPAKTAQLARKHVTCKNIRAFLVACHLQLLLFPTINERCRIIARQSFGAFPTARSRPWSRECDFWVSVLCVRLFVRRWRRWWKRVDGWRWQLCESQLFCFAGRQICISQISRGCTKESFAESGARARINCLPVHEINVPKLKY